MKLLPHKRNIGHGEDFWGCLSLRVANKQYATNNNLLGYDFYNKDDDYEIWFYEVNEIKVDSTNPEVDT